MANIQKIRLGCTDYFDRERNMFVMYNKHLIKSTGVLRVYDESSMAWWDSRIVSVKYIKCANIYKYEMEKL